MRVSDGPRRPSAGNGILAFKATKAGQAHPKAQEEGQGHPRNGSSELGQRGVHRQDSRLGGIEDYQLEIGHPHPALLFRTAFIHTGDVLW